MTQPPTITDEDRAAAAAPLVTHEDNLCTIALTEWLIMQAGVFDEDCSPEHQRMVEAFGEFADQILARHREAAIAQERERCAVLVESWNGTTRDGDTLHIAAAIRGDVK